MPPSRGCVPDCGAGPQLDVPHDVTPAQLETLLNGLLAQEAGEKLPYSFFVHEQQLAEELGAHLLRNKVRECPGTFAAACGWPAYLPPGQGA